MTEEHDPYKTVVEAARDTESDKIVITYSTDGPVALCLAENGHNWVSILHSSYHEQGDKLHWLNVDNAYLAEQMIDVLQTFVKNKREEEKKKNEKA